MDVKARYRAFLVIRFRTDEDDENDEMIEDEDEEWRRKAATCGNVNLAQVAQTKCTFPKKKPRVGTLELRCATCAKTGNRSGIGPEWAVTHDSPLRHRSDREPSTGVSHGSDPIRYSDRQRSHPPSDLDERDNGTSGTGNFGAAKDNLSHKRRRSEPSQPSHFNDPSDPDRPSVRERERRGTQVELSRQESRSQPFTWWP